MKMCNKVQVSPEQRKIGVTRRSVSGLYPFRGEPVAFESTLERDFLIRLDYCPNVLGVISQPVTLEYTSQAGHRRRYTPDYRVIFRVSPISYRPDELIEVKPRETLRQRFSTWKPGFRAAIRYCKERGDVFHIFDESRIRDQRWKNAMFLQRYRKMRFDEVDSLWILGNLRQMGIATFDHLLTRHFIGQDAQAMGISHLWHLVATRRIYCDLAQPLSRFTELWVATDDD